MAGIENYRLGLNDAGLKETEDAYRDALTLIQTKSIQLPYTSVIVDEAQDFGLNAFRLIRQLVLERKNDLFIVSAMRINVFMVVKWCWGDAALKSLAVAVSYALIIVQLG